MAKFRHAPENAPQKGRGLGWLTLQRSYFGDILLSVAHGFCAIRPASAPKVPEQPLLEWMVSMHVKKDGQAYVIRSLAMLAFLLPGSSSSLSSLLPGFSAMLALCTLQGCQCCISMVTSPLVRDCLT